jgi:imidazolonepropionase-like amidohydrolase
MRLVDLKGKHITPGLIDAHSHTGLFRFGVNESGQAVTAECRIGDSLDPGHINWYRQLAGGVTTANLLHGSANPIGGQSQIVKNRWGSSRPEDMFFEDAMPGIKFALGENVKQSNWGDDYSSRYPQTRMGVEAMMRDRFEAARAYATHHDRRDLELEALAQILAGKRLVHSHSYRQDEILMLCRVAEDFGFEIGTFQHGLEVYKVAETVRERARGASIFSDWWAYKAEVQDAIPYAGPLQAKAGVLTSYNSDSDELARRMSWEAGKAVKYSGGEMVGAEALAFVTINPAIQLGIADRVGSIDIGKDADLAIWSGDPLSSLSRCVATWVDGREYFSVEQDAVHRSRIAAERERLIQKALGAPVRDDAEDAGDAAEGDEEDELVDPERMRQDWLLIERLRAGELDGCDLIDHESRILQRIGD